MSGVCLGAVGGRITSRLGEEVVNGRRAGSLDPLENLQLKQTYGVLEAMERRKEEATLKCPALVTQQA